MMVLMFSFRQFTLVRWFSNNIQRLKLDVTRHVPIHGIVGSHTDFVRIAGASR